VAWADFREAGPSVALLQRSIERGRLGHAYLLAGEASDLLEGLARELACTVNCSTPTEVSTSGVALESCGRCSTCRRIREGLHPDVHWLRAESKMRLIRIEQVRGLIQSIQLKPSEGRYKVGVVVGADRLNAQSANAFLKTLEEPPPRSLLILLSTEPEQLLETILSRCLRLNFPGGGRVSAAELEWLRSLTSGFQASTASFLARYRLLDGLLRRLAESRTAAETEIEARSPARQYREADPELLEQWEEEAKAAVEAEYRRSRTQTVRALQWWFRDIWITTLGASPGTLALPELANETRAAAARLAPERARANLELLEETQTLLHTNVQEALALEVALLRLDL
jgi:DNA polymerase-3 subunit delta'